MCRSSADPTETTHVGGRLHPPKLVRDRNFRSVTACVMLRIPPSPHALRPTLRGADERTLNDDRNSSAVSSGNRGTNQAESGDHNDIAFVGQQFAHSAERCQAHLVDFVVGSELSTHSLHRPVVLPDDEVGPSVGGRGRAEESAFSASVIAGRSAACDSCALATGSRTTSTCVLTTSPVAWR